MPSAAPRRSPVTGAVDQRERAVQALTGCRAHRQCGTHQWRNHSSRGCGSM